MILPDDVDTVITRHDKMNSPFIAALRDNGAEIWSDQHCTATWEALKRDRPNALFKSMRDLYGKMAGQTVFICGSGPSLKNCPEKLPGLTLCINRAITKVKADYWCFGDLVVHRLFKDCENAKTQMAIGAGMHLFFPDEPVTLIEAEGKPSRYKRPEKRPLYSNCQTFSWALHWAVKMQPKRIILIGCDFSLDRHFDGTEAHERTGEGSVMCFQVARNRVDDMFGPDKAEWFDPSIEILDAAPNGYVPVPKTRLEDWL